MPEQLPQLKKEIIARSERESQDTQGEKNIQLSGVIDSEKELDQFLAHAEAEVSRLPDAQKYQEKIKALKPKLAELKDNYRFEYGKISDQYWEEFLTIVEADERTAIKHDKTIAAQLNLPAGTRIERTSYDQKTNTAGYNIFINGIDFHLGFHESGVIYVSYQGYDTWSSLVKRQHKYADSNRDRERFRDVSLAEIRDGSAFAVYHDAPSDNELSWAVSTLSSAFSEVPIRSADPEVQKLIVLKAEIEKEYKILEKFAQENRSVDQAEAKIPEVQARVAVFIRKIFDLKKSPSAVPYLTGLPKTISRLIEEHPYIIGETLAQVRDPEEFKLFEDAKDAAFLRGIYTKKEAEAISQSAQSLEKLPGYAKLTARHKELLPQLKAYLPQDTKELGVFVKAFSRIPVDVLRDYMEFLNSKDGEEVRKPSDIAKFTQAAAGLNQDRFRALTRDLQKHYAMRSPQFEDRRSVLNMLRDNELSLMVLIGNFWAYVGGKKEIEFVIREARARGVDEVMRITNGKSIDALRIGKQLDLTGVEEYAALVSDKIRITEMSAENLVRFNHLSLLQKKEGIDTLKTFDSHIYSDSNFDIFLDYAEIITAASEFFTVSDFFNHPMYLTLDNLLFYTNIKRTYGDLVAGPNAINRTEVVRAAAELKIAPAELLKARDSINTFDPYFKYQTAFLIVQMHRPDFVKTAEVLAGKKEVIQEICAYSSLYDIVYSGARRATNPEEFQIVLEKSEQLLKNKETPWHFFNQINLVGEKAKNFKELMIVIEAFGDPVFATVLKNILTGFDLENRAMQLRIKAYFTVAVTPESIATPQAREHRAIELKDFLQKAAAQHYDPEADPEYQRATALFVDDAILNHENADFTHISYILNFCVDKMKNCSSVDLKARGLRELNNTNPVIQEKWAKILIGLGSEVNDFDYETLVKLTAAGVDKKISSIPLSQKIKHEHLAYLRTPAATNFPLTLYYSFLVTLENNKQSEDQHAFEELVQRFKAIENEPVMQGEVVILTYTPNDSAHSFMQSSDTFDPTAYQKFAAGARRHSTILRFGEAGETKESMLSQIQLSPPGDISLVVAGHGGRGSIDFDRSRDTRYGPIDSKKNVEIREIFERLADRVSKNKGEKPWLTQIIFDSCHSDYNAEELGRLWYGDARTQNSPLRILSSSDEDGGSAKMTGDVLKIEAEHFEKLGRPLTWKDYYKEIESKLFIMSNVNSGLNSNSTLYINGKRLG